MSKIEVYKYSDTRIIWFEVFLTMIISSLLLIFNTEIHNAICIGVSFIAGGALFFLFRTRIGYWIVTLFFSCFWAGVAGLFTYYSFTSQDLVWGSVVAIFVFLISLTLHRLSRRFYDNVVDV